MRRLKRKKNDSGGDTVFEVPDAWLNTTIHDGLKADDVEKRRKKSGWNELTAEKENMYLAFLSYFQGPILYGACQSNSITNPRIVTDNIYLFPVMEMAAVLAAGLRDWIDFGVIIAILMLNATVGWYQEKRAADVVASLKGNIAMKALVVRDGQEKEVLAREIVPGDIVRKPRYAVSIIY